MFRETLVSATNPFSTYISLMIQFKLFISLSLEPLDRSVAAITLLSKI